MTARKPKRAKALGIDDAEYERLLAAQDGHCALCPATPATGHTRVWKCRYCKAPGNARDSVTCWDCGKARPKPPRLHADHDHATIGPDGRYRVRGLLCHRCNRNLPTWVSVEWLTRAIFYLEGVEQRPGDYVKVTLPL